MKKTIIIAAAAALTGTAIALYFFTKRKGIEHVPIPASNPRSHHVTNIFANAKKQIMDIKTEEV